MTVPAGRAATSFAVVAEGTNPSPRGFLARLRRGWRNIRVEGAAAKDAFRQEQTEGMLFANEPDLPGPTDVSLP